MASSELKHLRSDIREKAVEHMQRCQAAGIDLLIYCTYRSNDEQAALYAQGRTKPGKIVTYAKPGDSKHNHAVNGRAAALAYDCVPLRNGKAVWDQKDPVWLKVGQIGKLCGLSWAGDWKRFKEYPHFEVAE